MARVGVVRRSPSGRGRRLCTWEIDEFLLWICYEVSGRASGSGLDDESAESETPEGTCRVASDVCLLEVRVVTEPEASTQPEGTATAGSSSPRVRPLGIVLTFVVALVAIGGVAAFFISETYTSPNYPNGVQVAQSLGTAVVNGKSVQHVALHFQTYPDSTGSVAGKQIHPSGNPGWPAYGLSNQFQVPAHSLVTVTIRQYDSGGSLNNPWFAKVAGTVGGVASFTSPDGKTTVSNHADPDNIGHTFTMRSAPGVDSAFFLNVPLPTNDNLPNNQTDPDAGQYYTVKFSFISGSKGIYAWNCEFPCGQMVASFGGVMGAYGFMSGFVHVV